MALNHDFIGLLLDLLIFGTSPLVRVVCREENAIVQEEVCDRLNGIYALMGIDGDIQNPHQSLFVGHHLTSTIVQISAAKELPLPYQQSVSGLYSQSPDNSKDGTAAVLGRIFIVPRNAL